VIRALAPVLLVLTIGLVVLLYIRMSQGFNASKNELADTRDRFQRALDGLHAVKDEVQLQIDGRHPDLFLLRDLVQDSLAHVANPKRKEIDR
jgi:hypothetical protein